MSSSRRWLVGLMVLAGAAIALLWWAEFYTDWLWMRFDAYPVVFVTRLVTKWLAFLVVAPPVYFITAGHLRSADRSAVVLTALTSTEAELRAWIQTLIQPAVRWLPVLGALAVGLAAATNWQLWLLALYGRPFGVRDPQFGLEAGFYVYRLGALQVVLSGLLNALVVLTALVLLLYSQRRQIRVRHREVTLGPRCRSHLLLLAGCLLLVRAGLLWVRRYQLLLNFDGLFPGPGWTQAHLTIPALGLSAVAAVVAALACFAARRPGRTSRGALWAFGAHLALFVLGVGLVPALAQKIVVKPNESERELPYIARAITATRAAFGLDQVELRTGAGAATLDAAQLQAHAGTLDNVRIWDHRPLLRTLKQLQEIRQYYDIIDVDNDRYQLGGRERQVLVAARELNHAQLDDKSRSWLNLHLEYTHGYGLTMVSASGVDGQGQPSFVLRNLPPQGEVPLTQPRIYFGEVILLPPEAPVGQTMLPNQERPRPGPDQTAEKWRRRLNDVSEPDTTDYLLVGTSRDEFDYAETVDGQEVKHRTRYAGAAGVPVGSAWRRLLFALRFRSPELLLTRFVTPQSKLLMHRQVTRRCKRAAPFLVWDTQPYPVALDGRIVYVCEGYTMSQSYPCAALHYERQFTMRGWVDTPTWNYLRNPVKAVVDAYDGTVKLYVVDPADPLVQTYARIYPGVLQPAEAMPASLRAHLRYPQLLFRSQADMLGRYHMTDPRQFYAGEDLWATAREYSREIAGNIPRKKPETSPDLYQPMQSYYISMALPGESDKTPQFMLLSAYTPYNERVADRTQRDNMIAYLVGLCDPGHYGKLLAYRFPKDRTVYGPLQIEALINQDERVSQQMTLWDKGGSQVIHGHLLVVPVGHSLLYVQPLYLEAEQKGLPELKRVVVVYEQQVAMEPTLGGALERLFGAAPTLGDAPTVAVVKPNAPAPTKLDPGVAAEAQAAFAAFEAALKSGDWARAAAERERLRAALGRLR